MPSAIDTKPDCADDGGDLARLGLSSLRSATPLLRVEECPGATQQVRHQDVAPLILRGHTDDRQRDDTEGSLRRLVDDLKSTKTLLRAEDYPCVTLEQLNAYVAANGPLENPIFGASPAFWIDEGLLIPGRMVVYGRGIISSQMKEVLGEWIKWYGVGGRTTTEQGAYILTRDPNGPIVRMPDVAFTPRELHRVLATNQVWTYRGEPFAPSFVVEVDTLAGDHSQRAALDRKMREDYFPNGVQLGWLIDPHPERRIMMEYFRDENGEVQCSTDRSWRDLDGRDVLPGFRLDSVELEMVLNQAPGSSSEDEVDLQCPYIGCGQRFQTPGRFTAHSELHRKERAKAKYLARRMTTTSPSDEDEDDATGNDAHETRRGRRRRRQFRPYEGAQTHVGGRVDHASATPRGSRREDP